MSCTQTEMTEPVPAFSKTRLAHSSLYTDSTVCTAVNLGLLGGGLE